MRDRVLAGALVVPFLMGAAAAPSHPGHVELTFRDPDIIESSGLVVRDGLVVTTNDSGDSGRVFTVDPATGETVGVTHWSDDPTDVEALAPAGDHDVWVGDIGDNDVSRDSVQVVRVPVGRGDTTVDPRTYDLTYPDGPANAETLLSDPTTGRLYVATKDVFGGTLYAAPARLDASGTNRLRRKRPGTAHRRTGRQSRRRTLLLWWTRPGTRSGGRPRGTCRRLAQVSGCRLRRRRTDRAILALVSSRWSRSP